MSLAEISVNQLARLVGLPRAPVIIDVRSEEDYQVGIRLIPGSQRRDSRTVASWAADQPLLQAGKLPPSDSQGRTVWVTRARPKIDRIACPWLIRRFPATPFDIEGVFWSHRGERCTFDIMLEEFGLETAPLDQLATIVRGADTARPDLAPEAAGLLAASLGYSRMYKDNLAQLDAAMALYDAYYRWCRDAGDETHNWPSAKPTA